MMAPQIALARCPADFAFKSPSAGVVFNTHRRTFAKQALPNDPMHLYNDMFGDDDKNDSEGSIDPGKNTLRALRRYTRMRKAGQDLGLDAEKANQILGIVLEDASSLTGTSVVAAYFDGSARFFNGKQYHTGSSVEDEFLEKLVVNFFHFVAKESGQVTKFVKDGEREGPTKSGNVRISLLTPAGIRQAEFTSYSDVFDAVTAGADLGLYMIMST